MSVGEARVTTQTHRGHVRMEAEMRVTCPQTKERQGPRQPPEAGQARQISSLESEGTQPCPYPDFGSLASRAGRERPAVLSKAPSSCVGRAAPGNESPPRPCLHGAHGPGEEMPHRQARSSVCVDACPAGQPTCASPKLRFRQGCSPHTELAWTCPALVNSRRAARRGHCHRVSWSLDTDHN